MNHTALTDPIAPGDVLKGKYRVERILGQGGMGMVVAARHLELDEHVAIKFLLPHALTNADAVARFAREAQSAVKIKSQHVIRTFDVDRLDNGIPYIVMEYLDGVDLATYLHAHGALGVQDAVSFALQTCEALADAHAIGIVHRDLKPANLLLTHNTDGSECLKVLDFGISKITNPGIGGPNMGATSASTLMGSPLYMSPEQMASARNADVRSDIWSLGVTLFELLTGSPPFLAETIPDLCIKITMAPTPSVRERRPDVPEGLDAVVRRSLEKAPERRYANVGELAVALVPFGPRRSRDSARRALRVLRAAGLSLSATGLPPSTDPTPAADVAKTAEATVASWGQTQRPPRRRTGLAVGAFILVAVAAGVAMVMRSRVPGETVPTTSAAGEFSATAASAPLESPASASAALVAAQPPTQAAGLSRIAPGSAWPDPASSARPRDFVRSPSKGAQGSVPAAVPARPASSAQQKPPASTKVTQERSSTLPDYGGREY